MASIYDEIGGNEAVTAAVDVFYGHVLGDPVLAPWFRATDMRRQKAHMRAFMAAALGGPQIYGGRDMAAAHAGLGIGHRLDFMDPWGNRIEVVGYADIQFERVPPVKRKLGIEDLAKTEAARREIAERGLS